MIVTLNEILMENGTLNGSMTEICREDFDLNINSAIPKLPTHTVVFNICNHNYSLLSSSLLHLQTTHNPIKLTLVFCL